jgi:hypothetical protein
MKTVWSIQESLHLNPNLISMLSDQLTEKDQIPLNVMSHLTLDFKDSRSEQESLPLESIKGNPMDNREALVYTLFSEAQLLLPSRRGSRNIN